MHGKSNLGPNFDVLRSIADLMSGMLGFSFTCARVVEAFDVHKYLHWKQMCGLQSKLINFQSVMGTSSLHFVNCFYLFSNFFKCDQGGQQTLETLEDPEQP